MLYIDVQRMKPFFYFHNWKKLYFILFKNFFNVLITDSFCVEELAGNLTCAGTIVLDDRYIFWQLKCVMRAHGEVLFLPRQHVPHISLNIK